MLKITVINNCQNFLIVRYLRFFKHSNFQRAVLAELVRQQVQGTEGPRFKTHCGQDFFLCKINTPNGSKLIPIDGISVALKSAKGEIGVSENRTLGLRR
jgi:hypothetical protein